VAIHERKNGLAIAACIFDMKKYVCLYWYHSHNELMIRTSLLLANCIDFLEVSVLPEKKN
jgi:hypothetical protein